MALATLGSMIPAPGRATRGRGALREPQAERDPREAKESAATRGFLGTEATRVFKEFQALQALQAQLDHRVCWEELDILVPWEQRVTRAARAPPGDPDHLDRLVYHSMKEME